jgi:hypothetical protein
VPDAAGDELALPSAFSRRVCSAPLPLSLVSPTGSRLSPTVCVTQGSPVVREARSVDPAHGFRPSTP